MSCSARILLLAALGLLGPNRIGWSAITYVDATTANTTLQGGGALVLGVNYTTGAGPGALDGLWHLRTGVGNSNGVWAADETGIGTEDVSPLVTTFSFPESGGYQVFAYIWDSTNPGEDWAARVRLGNAGVYHKIQASEAEIANAARFTNAIVTSESARQLIQIPLGVVMVTNGGTAQVFVDDDDTASTRNTWYDGVGYEKVFTTLADRVVAIDFNKTNTPGAPAQAMFRSVSGSGTTSQNPTVITKQIGACTVRLTKTSATAFDFRGANGDSTRVIPGGPTSLSSLVADFVGTRDGTINIGLSNLTAGTYLFRSYHLDTFNTGNLGYAQGGTSTTPNTLRALVGGSLAAVVQPTALGSSGLATNYISDADVPKMAFPFNADGSNVVTINLSAVYTNGADSFIYGADSFIFLNGFEVLATVP